MPTDDQLDARQSGIKVNSTRLPARQDRDRILYSSEFRRLAGVTQVATATEQLLIHNRITHSTKVEQVGTGIVDFHDSRDRTSADTPQSLMPELGRANEWRVAAAGLGHDLGHPPFGHIGERTLDEIVTCEIHRKRPLLSIVARRHDEDGSFRAYKGEDGVDDCECLLPDGFEGNAQSLRIVTKLTVRANQTKNSDITKPPTDDYRRGLDLTRGTLLALTKYPWLRGDNPAYPSKWGAYDCDSATLIWLLGTSQAEYAKQVDEATRDRSSKQMGRHLLAYIMDWADDITYAVHDIDDFYRIGLVPLEEVARKEPAARTMRAEFLEYAITTIDYQLSTGDEISDLRRFAESWLALLPERKFSGLPSDIAAINGLVSTLIDLFISSTNLEDGELVVKSNIRFLNAILKQLTWYYVIDNPNLATIQAGQQKMLRELYQHIYTLASAHYLGRGSNIDQIKRKRRLPAMVRYYVDYTMLEDRGCRIYSEKQRMIRGILDFLSSLTDIAVQRLYARLTGEPGISILEPTIAM